MEASSTSLATAVGTATASSASSLVPYPIIVGSGWMFSSIVFSTYYTTAFLTNGIPKEKNDFHERKVAIMSGNEKTSEIQASANTRRAKFNNTLKNMSRSKLLTLYRFSGSLLLGVVGNLNVMECGQRIMDTIKYMGAFSVPALFLFVANYCNSIALERIGISLTYTSKCLIPLITVLMTLLVDGMSALPPTLALIMLIPIASGVALASWNSPSFDKSGFLAAIISSTAQAALNVFSKKSLQATGISGLQAQRSMASVALIITICITVSDALRNRDQREKEVERPRPALPSTKLSVAAAAAYHFEYVLSFLFLTMVTPIEYGTCDAVRRLGIIVAGRKFFGGEPFSSVNYGGIALALLGAMGYSIGSAKK